jgi:GNAT superfamily N-acetyltransferase
MDEASPSPATPPPQTGLPLNQPPAEGREFARRGAYFLSTDRRLLDVGFIHRFLSEESYWAPGIPREVVERSIAHSLCFGLFHESQQVGFARMVTDRATFAWLGDVFVIDAHRGQGLGKWMIEALLTHPDLQGLRRCMLGTRDAHGLYERFGFTPPADPSRFLEIHTPNVYGSANDGAEVRMTKEARSTKP